MRNAVIVSPFKAAMVIFSADWVRQGAFMKRVLVTVAGGLHDIHCTLKAEIGLKKFSVTHSSYIFESYLDGAVSTDEAFVACGGKGDQVNRRRATNRTCFFF